MPENGYPPESYKPGNCDICGAPAEKYHGAKELCPPCYSMQPTEEKQPIDHDRELGVI